jgi:hypothetical protein
MNHAQPAPVTRSSNARGPREAFVESMSLVDVDFDAGMPGRSAWAQADWEWARRASKNNFERLLWLSDPKMFDVVLRAAFTNASEACLDGVGNLWFSHVSPRAARPLAFCVDQRDGAILHVEPWPVFEIAYEDGDRREEFEEDGALEALRRKKVRDHASPDARAAEATLRYLWMRSAWPAVLLRGSVELATRIEPRLSRVWDEEMAHPQFADVPGYVLYQMWRAFFLGQEPLVRKTVAAAKRSSLVVVRDTAALLEGVLGGRRIVAGVDLEDARRKFRRVS